MEDLTINIGDNVLNCRVAGIIIHNNKMLIHHNTKDSYYALLGGRVKIGESSENAIRREFKEELGKEIEIQNYITTVENFFIHKNKKYHEILFVYKVEFKENDDKKIETTLLNIEGDEEKHVEYKWIELSNIKNEPLRPSCLKKYLSNMDIPRNIINDDLNIEKTFKKITGDKRIKEIYKIIQEKTSNEGNWATHDWTHVNNVTIMIEEILRKLNYDEETIEAAKIAGLLHDTGVIDGKNEHAYRSYEFAKKYFEENNIDFPKKELVLEAIKNHSDGFDTDNIIQLVLILADKLDLRYTRVTSEGLKIEGMRQTQYIEDIKVDIDSNYIKVYFICKNEINKKELEEYYFLKKVGNAIKSFAKKMNLKYEVYFNNEFWSEILS